MSITTCTRSLCRKPAAFVAYIIVASFSGWPSHAALPLRAVTTEESPSVQRLGKIETWILPEVLVDGNERGRELADYYWSANASLHQRLLGAQTRYTSADKTPFRSMTLIAGSAGIGKTFIKGRIADNRLPNSALFKFDIKELYQKWDAAGKARLQADLQVGPYVLSEMLSGAEPGALLRYLENHDASFYIIDSLDEIHPSQYHSVLEQVEQFVFHGNRDFVHVVVLGRPFAFYDYWADAGRRATDRALALYTINPPQLQTTGDLLVSSWNYHTWKYKLRWNGPRRDRRVMPLGTYRYWVDSRFSATGPFQMVSVKPNNSTNMQDHATLYRWATKYRFVAALLRNLAANGILREIAAQWTADGRQDDELAIKLAFFEAWLEREANCVARPGGSRQDHLVLYLSLLRNLALKYADSSRLDEEGAFHVGASDNVDLSWGGESYQIPASVVLDHSGLATLLPTTQAKRRYRFEPIWIHRLLLETEPTVVPDP